MRKIIEVLRLHHEGGRSHREIARMVSTSPTTVGEILRRAKQCGLSYPLPAVMSEMGLEAQLYPPAAPSSLARPEPDWPTVHRELRRQLPKKLCIWLREAGHDVIHTLDLPLGNH